MPKPLGAMQPRSTAIRLKIKYSRNRIYARIVSARGSGLLKPEARRLQPNLPPRIQPGHFLREQRIGRELIVQRYE